MKISKSNLRFSSSLSFLIILFSFGINTVKGQELPSKEDKAERLFTAKQYSRAAYLYEILLKHKNPNHDLYQSHLAYCYLAMRETNKAEESYEKIFQQKKINPINYFYFGEALFQNGKYGKALLAFQEFLPYAYSDKIDIVQNRIQSCELFGQSNPNPAYTVNPLKEINTEYSEFGMMNMGDDYIFTSDRDQNDTTNLNNNQESNHKSDLKHKTDSMHKISLLNNDKHIYGWTGLPYLKLYRTRTLAKNEYSTPIPDKDFNSVFHIGPLIITKNKKRVYYTQTNTIQPISHFSLKENPIPIIQRLEIYYRDFINGKWSSPKSLPFNNKNQYSVGQPALSTDEKILYFVSDMPGTLGGSDLFSTVISGDSLNKFSLPKNLGNEINTTGNELFPACDSQGNLYFSSDGRIGMGGLDIYKATPKPDSSYDILNLGSPINSSKDDFSLGFSDSSGSSGFFSSDRDLGKGKDDIYAFEFKFKPVLLVQILQAENLIPIVGVNVKIDSNLKVSDIHGKVSLLVDTNHHYFIKAFKNGILDSACAKVYILKNSPDTVKVILTLSIPTVIESLISKNQNKDADRKPKSKEEDQENDLTENIPMTKVNLVKGNTFVLKKFYYDLDKWNIRKDAAIQLDKLFIVLEENPKVQIQLNSHTDSRGSEAYNNLLSQLRADAAVRYLTDKGISAKRLRPKGFGKTKILNKCKTDIACTEAEHQLNRRTEITIL